MDFIFNQYAGVPTLQVALELIAVFLGLISVIYAKKTNILVYPTGIISTAIYVYLLWINQLFGDMLINVYYTAMSIYGWILWSQNSQDMHIRISKTTKADISNSILLALFSAILTLTIYYFRPAINNNFSTTGTTLSLSLLTWSDYTDTFTTAVFLSGMWLMAKRKIENWTFWIIGDLISVPLYIYKGLIFSSIQYFIFTLIAISALQEWKKIYKSYSHS